jgi:RNA polymerase sigma factor (sigma-70 family)
MDDAHVERTRRFDALFHAFSSDVVAYCGWRSESSGEADDAVAEVFLIAWRRLDDLPDGGAARVWLYATARRVLANQRRSRRRRLALRDRLAHEAIGVADQVFPVGSDDRVVHEALRRLRPRDREVLLLAEWEALTPSEIARVLGCRIGTARGRLHRARFRFRVAFEELRTDTDDERPGLAGPRARGTSDQRARRGPDRPSIEETERGDDRDIGHVRRAQASQPAL